MNLPNKLTILRIVMVPLILVFILPISFISDDSAWNLFINDYGMIIAFVLFGIASLTDYIDGQIARKRGIVTNIGKFLDPIADKILVASVLIALVQLNKINTWIAVIIIGREFIVTAIRLLAADKGIMIAANNLGKVKTVVQIIAVLSIIIKSQLSITLSYMAKETSVIQILLSKSLPYIELTTNIILIITVVITVLSGYDYLKKNLNIIKE